jgi:hypothetical protein
MSQVPEQDDFFDVDRDIIAPLRSPPLVAVEPSFRPHESPPPLVPLESSSDSDEEDIDGPAPSRKPRKRKGRTKSSLADGVLIRALDPNQGEEVARHAERHALDSVNESEVEEDSNATDAVPGQDQMRRPSHVHQHDLSNLAPKAEDVAKAVLNAIDDDDDEDDFQMVETPEPRTNGVALEFSPLPAAVMPKPETPKRTTSPQAFSQRSSQQDHSKRQFNTVPPPLNAGLRLNLQPRPDPQEAEEDSIITSPALGKFAITPRDAHPDSILPAMHQRSPPRSSPAGSPDHRQPLPNIKTALTSFHDAGFAGFAAMSPSIGRPSPGQSGPYTSPAAYSAMSPPGPPNQFNWRSMARDSNNSTSSEYTASSATASTPASSMIAPSPANTQPTPSASISEHDIDHNRRESNIEEEPNTLPESGADDRNDDLAGSYKCTYNGCNAMAFQTQYLLNSHMNVHSNTRTHFCPVKGCPRGPGGQGFKRKNEMIRWVNDRKIQILKNSILIPFLCRHGLVHTSPGYICPFCPDQQHKYPRPDNLQRHVRQHHTERDRDDPVLRDVLSQRIEGGGANRGGRRRMRL